LSENHKHFFNFLNQEIGYKLDIAELFLKNISNNEKLTIMCFFSNTLKYDETFEIIKNCPEDARTLYLTDRLNINKCALIIDHLKKIFGEYITLEQYGKIELILSDNQYEVSIPDTYYCCHRRY